MNEYGRRALEHWRRSKPVEFASIPDREGYFSTLGQSIAAQVDALTVQIAGPDSPAEGYLGRVGRLNSARAQAEEMVLADWVYWTTPEKPDQDEEPDDPTAVLDRSWAREDRLEREQFQREQQDAANRAWRKRTGNTQ